MWVPSDSQPVHIGCTDPARQELAAVDLRRTGRIIHQQIWPATGAVWVLDRYREIVLSNT